ncbi:MAG: hypothetical protein OHK0045_01550 [Raineya sp.]
MGLSYAYAFSNNWAVQKNPDGSISYFRDERNNFGISAYGRVIASTMLDFFEFRKNKQFSWGDVFLVESKIGFRRQQIERSNHILLGYNFSAGLMANYLINEQNEIGLIFVPLKFTSDKVSPNISGSYIGIRYANRHICLTIQHESRDLSFLGWLILPTLNPRQYTLEMLFKKKYGFRAEWAANRYTDTSFGGQYQNSFPSISIFFAKTL